MNLIIQKPLKRRFYNRDTRIVAEELLGKYLIRKTERNEYLVGKIVETEAYMGDHDPGCHAYQKFTERSSVLYEDAGTIYVYFIYGNYFCFNIVTEEKGKGCAVLIRAVEPVNGIEMMKMNRLKAKNIFDITNGPAKLCMAFGIDKKFNRENIFCDALFISMPNKREKFEICKSKRIGLKEGKDFYYRYFIKDNPYVTKHRNNKECKVI